MPHVTPSQEEDRATLAKRLRAEPDPSDPPPPDPHLPSDLLAYTGDPNDRREFANWRARRQVGAE